MSITQKIVAARIARNYLLISQCHCFDIPSRRSTENLFLKRAKRNDSLTKGTIIVEAGETSGTLTGSGCHQGRKLFILGLCRASDIAPSLPAFAGAV